MKIVLYSLMYIMPCVHCRESYKHFVSIVKFEDVIDNNQDLFEWSYDIHERVNQKLHEQKCDQPYTPFLTLNELEQRYGAMEMIWDSDVITFYRILYEHFPEDTERQFWMYAFLMAFPALIKPKNPWIDLFSLPDNDCTFQRMCIYDKKALQKFVEEGVEKYRAYKK